MADDNLDERNEWPVLPVGGVARDRHGFCRNAQPARIPCREKSKFVCRFVKGSLSGGVKHPVDGDSDDVAWEDVRPSRKEGIKGIIDRLSKPSKIRSIFGPGLTEHAKKYGAPMDLADAVALDRRVDAKYAAREKAGMSKKNAGNRRA